MISLSIILILSIYGKATFPGWLFWIIAFEIIFSIPKTIDTFFVKILPLF